MASFTEHDWYVCRDTICDMGFSSELANYGEYSGAPSEGQTYEYAKTVLSLMTREHRPEGTLLWLLRLIV
jgi:ATP citrate (pro-S)-lyase